MSAAIPRPCPDDESAWPSDALILLVGASGSGKTTWAARHFAAEQVLSSDAFRAMVAGDASDQSATRDAFRLLHDAARARLRRGLLTVVDATNLAAGARGPLLRLAREAGRPAVAVVFDLPLARCLAQNARRPDRHVPEAVVRRHVRQATEARASLAGEGLASICLIGAAELDGRYDEAMPTPLTAATS